jgi:hypothetical protein
MPAPLEAFLHAVTSGHNVLTQEMYDHFGGDAILDALRKYDPDARFTETQMPGEGNGIGYRLDFDASKLPASKGGMAGYDLNPSNLHDNVKNPGAVYDDPVYGSVTNSANFYKDADPLWTKLAPIAVGMLAPMAGAALAGAGIGGTAGLTAAATGSGLGGAATIPSWAAQLIAKSPQLAGQIDNGQWQSALQSVLMQAGGAAGLPMNTIKAGLTLAQLARRP